MSKGKRVPPLSITDTGSYRGRLQLRGVYPSASGGPANVTNGHDDGTITDCSCKGWQTHGKCWHIAALVDDYWRSIWGAETLAALRWREGEILHYLGLGPDEAEANALRLELTTLGDLVGTLTQTERAA